MHFLFIAMSLHLDEFSMALPSVDRREKREKQCQITTVNI